MSHFYSYVAYALSFAFYIVMLSVNSTWDSVSTCQDTSKLSLYVSPCVSTSICLFCLSIVLFVCFCLICLLCLSVLPLHLSVHFSIFSSLCLSIFLSVYMFLSNLSICPKLCLFIDLSFFPFIFLSVCFTGPLSAFVYLSLPLSVCLSVCLSICLFLITVSFISSHGKFKDFTIFW